MYESYEIKFPTKISSFTVVPNQKPIILGKGHLWTQSLHDFLSRNSPKYFKIFIATTLLSGHIFIQLCWVASSHCSVLTTGSRWPLEHNWGKLCLKQQGHWAPSVKIESVESCAWIDSKPFDKTWKPGWNDLSWVNRFHGRALSFRVNLHHGTEPCAQLFIYKASPFFFFFIMGQVRSRRGRIQSVRTFWVLSRRFYRSLFPRRLFFIF